jgi:DNA mismatch repair ATPase MutS
MAINHDLTHRKAYQIAFANHADYVCFLDLGNRLEIFGMDALLLEKEYDIEISRITPSGRTDGLIRYACRVSIKEGIELICKLIANGHNVALARLLTSRALDAAETCDCGEPFPESGYCKFCGARQRQRQ